MCNQSCGVRRTVAGGWWVYCHGCRAGGTVVDFVAKARKCPKLQAAYEVAAALGVRPAKAAVRLSARAHAFRRRLEALAADLKEYPATAAALHQKVGCSGRGKQGRDWGTVLDQDTAPARRALNRANPLLAHRFRKAGRGASLPDRAKVFVPAYDFPDRVVGGWTVDADGWSFVGVGECFGRRTAAAGFPGAWRAGHPVLTFDAAAALRMAAAAPGESPAVPVTGTTAGIAGLVAAWGSTPPAVLGPATPAVVRLARTLGAGVVPPAAGPDPSAAVPWPAAAAAYAARLPDGRCGEYVRQVGGAVAFRDAVPHLPVEVAARLVRELGAPRRTVRVGRLTALETAAGWVDSRTGEEIVNLHFDVIGVGTEGHRGVVEYAVKVGFRDPYYVPSTVFRNDPVEVLEAALAAPSNPYSSGRSLFTRPRFGRLATPEVLVAIAFDRYDRGEFGNEQH